MAGSAPDHAVTRWIEGSDGSVLDARVDYWDQTIALHSRGGATGGRPARNTMYEAALFQIVRRGTQNGNVFSRILIDSDRAVTSFPEESDRLLLDSEEIDMLSPAELVRKIRVGLRTFGQKPGTKGGNSTKRVRFDVKYGTSASIFRLRKKGPSSQQDERLPVKELRAVTLGNVRQAADQIASGHAMPAFAPSKDYDVIYDDNIRLAPKKVFGRALELALNIQAHPAHFSAGLGTPCFDLIERAGFEIIAKSGDSAADVAKEIGDVGLSAEDKTFIEGSKKRAQHLRRERNRELVREFKSQFLEKHGRFFCEECGEDWRAKYGKNIASSCFDAHHAATQVGEMDSGHESKLSDLQLLCANCHRAEHRRMKLET